MTPQQFLQTEWDAVTVRVPVKDDMARRAEWERIIDVCTRRFGHVETSAAIVKHVLGKVD